MKHALMGILPFAVVALYKHFDKEVGWPQNFQDQILRAGDVFIIIDEIKTPGKFSMWKVLSKFGVMFAIPKHLSVFEYDSTQ